MECEEAKLSDGSSGWISHIPKNIHAKDRPLLDISSQAVWALSSCKTGYGVDELLSDNVEKYWQSDGPQPHTILLEFQKKTDVAVMMFYLDFKNDESYTPSKIQVKMGSSHQDIFFRTTQTFHEPQGWTFIDLRDKSHKPNRVFWIQVQVMQNHQNGRDTHIRHVRVLGPERSRVASTNRIFTGEPHCPITDREVLTLDEDDFSSFVDHSLMDVPECEMPGIPIDSANLEILTSPSSFYQKFLELTTKTKKRLALSSLYLGEGDLEKKLVWNIKERMNEADIEVTILLDFLRGTRKNSSGESSVSVLKPISDKAKVYLYHTPKLNGLVKRILPQRADEIIGLQHMKLYIFDDNVLISGANLSESYFTDRTDRWFLFKNCKPLADFFHEIITTVGDTSFIVQKDQVVLSTKCDVHPYLGGTQLYRQLLKYRIEAVIEKYRESRKKEGIASSETLVYPILQMGLLGINHEFNLLNKLLAIKNSDLKMTMASGYFNFIKDYEDLILTKGTYQMNILTASPFANGFFESKGFSKYIPPLYSNISEQFLRKQRRNHRESVQMHQYFREGWTFHAKGLWIEHKNQIMTLVGSSNYGYRSVHRDLEAQVMIVTSDQKLVNRLKDEKDRLFEHSSILDMTALQQPEHHVPRIVRVISRLVRSFL